MSLINEMLRDLEKRNRGSKQATHDNIIALHAMSSSHAKKYYVAIAVLLLLIVFSVLLLVFHKKTKTVVLPQSVATAKPQPVAEVVVPEKKAAIADTNMTGVSLQMHQDMTYLKFMVTQPVLYHVNSHAETNEVEIILEHTHLVNPLPEINYALSGIEKITASNDKDGNLQIVLQLNPTASLQRLGMVQEKTTEFQLDIQYKNYENPSAKVIEKAEALASAAASASTSASSDKPVVVEDLKLNQYQYALDLAGIGKKEEAIQILRNVVNHFPDYLDAQESLISLLQQQGQFEASRSILEKGLLTHPDYLPFIELKAHLLVDDHKIEQAVRLLEDEAPPLAEDPEYHALLAALYQKKGQPLVAANLYKQLLEVQSNNAMWWLGLAVALDTGGQHTQAVDAYVRADTIGGLKPELMAYIETRLHTKG